MINTMKERWLSLKANLMPLASFHSSMREKPIIPAHMIMATPLTINLGVQLKQTKILTMYSQIGVFAMMKSTVTFQNAVSKEFYF